MQTKCQGEPLELYVQIKYNLKCFTRSARHVMGGIRNIPLNIRKIGNCFFVKICVRGTYFRKISGYAKRLHQSTFRLP